ncbi:pyridoxal phosphate-dependent aminotransferase [Micrococcus flavus]|uniref:alanine transaminase n=1 Tax=Micrococcus flavus TaxID=384602 RepID=A0A4Y8X4S4_9MICC|nr:pyridoxal phosphate-dependent aminotransferase [Micrococcus flavus]MBB4882225.1 alanine-synthesizing transaminase [Micrococcus flavus]TFI03855.1 pyridoxal phosphate-dependent aminotransferase [Micrococcus flavus]GGK51283.1 aminotransferase [Micrococcus flavus]
MVSTGAPREIRQSSKLLNVRYDVRGPILEEAQRMEAAGHRIMKLNIGNPAPFGFEAPDSILQAMYQQLPHAQGYSDSKGIYSARTAVSQYYESRGIRDISVDDVFVGNGVSEMISMVLQALVDDGDEVLIPSPDYPLWTGATTLSGGSAVHYRCVEEEGWEPDLEHMESLITERTKAVVLINPNNPTGAVYSRQVLNGVIDLARRHNLVLLADEIYEKITYDGARHINAAGLSDDVLTLTFSGLSKAYRVAGFRSGWVAVSGPKHRARDFLEGLTLLANMRMCANVPAQHAIQVALGGYQSIEDLILPGGRLLEQRNLAQDRLNAIEGVSVQPAQGALYLFPRLDPEVYPIDDDEKFVIELLRAKKILVSHGGAFNYPHTDHFRLVTLPSVKDLDMALDRLEDFLEDWRDRRG